MTLLLALILTAAFAFQQLTTPIYTPGKAYPIDPTKPSIVITHIPNNFGGIEGHIMQLYKRLVASGYPATLVMGDCPQLTQQLDHEQLSYYVLPYMRRLGLLCRRLSYVVLERELQPICTQHQARIIHANSYHDAIAARAVARTLGIKSAVTLHGHWAPTPTGQAPHYCIDNLDAVVCVNPFTLNDYVAARDARKKPTNITCWIPPLFNVEKFEAFTPMSNDRTQYFKNSFGLSVDHEPVITMVANFYTDPMQKNHGLLIKAVNILVHQKKIPLKVILAGSAETGSNKRRLQELQQQVTHYKLDANIHFLGFVENAAELMHHSDIVMLSSAREGMPLVLVEAGFLQRPTVGASDTGTAVIINHEKTGLIFKNNDVNDLVLQLERLIQDPAWAQQLGRQAHAYVNEKFHPDRSFAQYEDVYAQVMRS